MEVSKILSILLKIVIYILLLFSKRDALTQQMSLGECVKQAIENHPDIKASYLQTGMSQAGIDQAKSNFLPQLGANIYQSGNF
jgi:outer membrane protein TolC